MTLHFELTGANAAVGVASGAAASPRSGRLVLDRSLSSEASAPASTLPSASTLAPAAIALETPTFLKYTRHGLQPHLVREVAAELSDMPACTRVQLEDFLEDDGSACGQHDAGLHNFVFLDRSEVLLLDTLDPTVTRRVGKSTNSFLAIDSEGGTKRLTPEVFAQLVDRLKPDIIIPPADYIEEPLPSLTQGKRISKSVTRSAKWLDESIAKSVYPSAVFAAVMGSHSPELRDISAKKLLARSDVAGYVFNDVSLALPFESKLQLVQHSLAQLDASKPRYMVGASAPDAALRAILGGIDLVDSSYPYAVTEQGFASTYVFGGEGPAGEIAGASAAAAGRLDLWQESMFNDFGPLVEGCSCFTCRSHHRAYIHHLLMTKEMLSTVLLQIHNMHWYQGFFADIRSSLARATLAEDAQRFLERYGPSSEAFGELETLATQESSPTTKIQRKRHAEPL
ncbi:hypothetical protein LPJ66_009889 [Kickxella alabastrina]|uniref:Uncharacterized protein n=1 Tax=Kickxella alabastrina TaxID=61397 RepID=A0ACC1I2L2_9FUNG|nr:hypothetical protein LPJ66_009889 [Kickxella alabastrina]